MAQILIKINWLYEKLVPFGSVLNLGSDGITVNTLGGQGGDGTNNGQNGRFITGSNTPVNLAESSIVGREESYTGAREINPFILGSYETPYIPDLTGGAEVYGLLDGWTISPSVIPGNSSTLLARLTGGIPGYEENFPGFDLLVMANISATALIDPILGIDPTNRDPSFAVPLLQGGPATNPLFGGSGPQQLATLAPGSVYALLIPKNGTIFNLGFDGSLSGGLHLVGNKAIYLDGNANVVGQGAISATGFIPVNQSPVPEPATWILLVSGLIGLGWVRRRSVAW